MSHWFERLRFLWEEETAPAEEAALPYGDESAGVPRSMRRTIRFAVIALIAVGTMSSIIGATALIAPVAAYPHR